MAPCGSRGRIPTLGGGFHSQFGRREQPLPANHLPALDAHSTPRMPPPPLPLTPGTEFVCDRPGSVAIRTSFRVFFSVRPVGAVAIEMEECIAALWTFFLNV